MLKLNLQVNSKYSHLKEKKSLKGKNSTEHSISSMNGKKNGTGECHILGPFSVCTTV